MYRFLLTRQWVILTLIGLVLIPVMIELGFWQLHRHENRVARNERIGKALDAPPVPAERLTSPGREVPDSAVYRAVTAKGTYDAKHEVVVRRRTNGDDEVGFHVLTPFVLDDGKVLLVNRGWIPADGPQTAFPKIPAPPRGEVTVTGRLMRDETSAASGIKDVRGLPDRQIMLISSGQQAHALGKQVLGGYVQQTAPSADSPQLLGAPDHSGIGPHMAYAVQWWLFAAGVPAGWVVLVRRERKDRLAAAETAPAEPAEASPATA
ncbi:SURF1 family cytochrome oxidase biogenesis protein [Streptomyces aureoverticillatus]|uniref:SURF1 family cytochrome oxidase biogenesis protein n=1 Tax=Streptomyces aureoverticillatus TaxID=66871 RepID=UPI0013DB96E0|nr:SURF1 family protein [Streptomyces aureoverticillatus]QIB46567.1 SURF1 family protein [Streptomyces aureoverticillatus]